VSGGGKVDVLEAEPAIGEVPNEGRAWTF